MRLLRRCGRGKAERLSAEIVRTSGAPLRTSRMFRNQMRYMREVLTPLTGFLSFRLIDISILVRYCERRRVDVAPVAQQGTSRPRR